MKRPLCAQCAGTRAPPLPGSALSPGGSSAAQQPCAHLCLPPCGASMLRIWGLHMPWSPEAPPTLGSTTFPSPLPALRSILSTSCQGAFQEMLCFSPLPGLPGSKLGPQEWLPEHNRTDAPGEGSHPSCRRKDRVRGSDRATATEPGRSRWHMVRDTRRCYRQGSHLGDTTSQRETAQRGEKRSPPASCLPSFINGT